jgi:hypothetical protein
LRRQAGFCRQRELVCAGRPGSVSRRSWFAPAEPKIVPQAHRHTATSYLRNSRLPDGSPAVKEDVERYLLGHSEKDSNAGYGKQWIETLKAAIEVIPDPLHAVKDGASAGC